MSVSEKRSITRGAFVLTLFATLLFLFLKPGYALAWNGITYHEGGETVRSAIVNGTVLSENGTAVRNGLYEIEGETYYSENFRIRTGLCEYRGDLYYADSEGRVLKGFFETADGRKMHANEDGKVSRGFFLSDGHRYFSHPDGTLANGFFTDGTNIYHAAAGQLTTGKAEINGEMFIFAPDGKQQTGRIRYRGKTYFADEYGVLAKSSFVTDADGTRYYKADGSMAEHEFIVSGGKTYRFGDDGLMLTGETRIGRYTYLFSEAGEMQTGWHNGKLYLPSGKRAENMFRTIGKRTYYFTLTGATLEGAVTVGDTPYYFDQDGYLLTGWHEGKFYLEDGQMARGTFVTDGEKKFWFDENGDTLSGLCEIDGTEYLFSDEGCCLYGWQEVDGEKLYFCYDDGSIAYGSVTTADGTYNFYRGKIVYNAYRTASSTYSGGPRNVFMNGGYYWNDGSFWDLSSDGDLGRVFIPDGGYTAALYNCHDGNTGSWQTITNWSDSCACLTWFRTYCGASDILADHNYQGFSCLNYMTPGASHLYILIDGVVQRDYVCAFVDPYGSRGSTSIWTGGLDITESAYCDLWSYTCHGAYTTVAGWNRVG